MSYYTADDLIAWLPIVAGPQWRVSEGRIRDNRGRCPLCALADEIRGEPTGETEWAGIALHWAHVPDAVSDKRGWIMLAADRPRDPMRPALMAALGMTR